MKVIKLKPDDITWRPAPPITLLAEEGTDEGVDWQWSYMTDDFHVSTALDFEKPGQWTGYALIHRYPGGLTHDDDTDKWQRAGYEAQEGFSDAADPHTALDLAFAQASAIKRANEKKYTKKRANSAAALCSALNKAADLLIEYEPDDE